MRQNDLQKRSLVMVQPTKKGNVFMWKGVGKLHPLFLLHSKRGTHFLTSHLLVSLMLGPYPPAS